MAIKILGMVLILFSTTMTGLYFSERYRYRAEDISSLKQALVMLKNQILFLAMPLPEGMQDVSIRIGGSVGKFFETAAGLMEQRTSAGAEIIWEQAVLKNCGGTYFVGEDLDAIIGFGKSLGYLNQTQQEASIDLLLTYLSDTEQQLLDKRAKNSRLYGSMGVLGGILMIVVLL